ncbi:hypothetical protein Ahos_0468 [Acidianus hospitalis W1]|uniref:Uncharacterized protein n=1 Tax=Acidianus hospitalis (strain W1) TaxID=933801 RepID=F4B668_ACIHW|nr:hypothetical protein Ahos_0468 [Acidianus hospitalis W1]
MVSIEVTRNIRILYSMDLKNCIVFIWKIGSHKKERLAFFSTSSKNLSISFSNSI